MVDAIGDDEEIVFHFLTQDAVIDEPVDFISVVDADLVCDFDNVESLSCQFVHSVCMTDGVLYLNVVREPFP